MLRCRGFFSVYQIDSINPMGDNAENDDDGGDDDDVHSVYRLNWHFKDENVRAVCADCFSFSSTSDCAVL